MEEIPVLFLPQITDDLWNQLTDVPPWEDDPGEKELFPGENAPEA